MYEDIPKMILAFQRWIICIYEHVPRDMDEFYVCTQILYKSLFGISAHMRK